MHIDTQQTQLPPTLGILTTNTHAILVCKEDEEVMYLGSFGSISTTSANLIQKRILIVMMKVVLSFQRKGNGKTGNGTKRK